MLIIKTYYKMATILYVIENNDLKTPVEDYN